MTATVTDMADFVTSFARCIPRGLHPVARDAIHRHMVAMCAAGDPAEVLALMERIKRRVVWELRWEAKKREGFPLRDHRAAHKLRSAAARFEARA